jgi:hypothetical protein
MPKKKKDYQIEVAKYTLFGTVVTAVLGLIGVLLTPILERQNSVPPTIPVTIISGNDIFLGIAILLLIIGLIASVIMNFFYYRKYFSSKAIELRSENAKLNLHKIEKYLEKRIQIKQIRDDNNSTMTEMESLLKDYEAQEETLLLDGILPLLKSLLESGTKDTNSEEIIKIFAKLKLVDTDLLIIELLRQSNPTLQSACADALGELRTKLSSAFLHKILKNPGGWHRDVVSHSVIAIEKINPPDYLQLLIKLLFSDDVSDETKSIVISALGRLNSDKAKSYIRAYEISRIEGKKLEDVFRHLSKNEK